MQEIKVYLQQRLKLSKVYSRAFAGNSTEKERLETAYYTGAIEELEAILQYLETSSNG